VNDQQNNSSKQDWVQPELKRLSAGSAEAGGSANEDGGNDPTNARS
jgi:hypothetical protein